MTRDSPRFPTQAYGHELSSIIDGGLFACTTSGFPVEAGAAMALTECSADYPAVSSDAQLIRDYDQIVANSSRQSKGITDAELVLDARPRGRWAGVDPEPRANMPSGHIPHSLTLPFSSLLETNAIPGSDTKFTTLLEPPKLKMVISKAIGEKRFAEVMEGSLSVINTCGSGMTAAVVWLALRVLGANSAIYDESWSGYVAREGSRIEVERTI